MASRPKICASSLKLLLIIAITIQLDLFEAVGSHKARTTRAHHPSDINSGCDLLFAGGNSGGGGAQDYCQCRDSDPIEQLAPGGGEPQPPAAPGDDLSSSASISQLDCRHGNASELLGALSRAFAGATGPKFKLDYLSIQTNVTYGDGEWRTTLPARRLAQVDQLTATLVLTGDARASSAENLLSSLASQLLEPDRLQSLTLVIVDQVAHPPPEEVSATTEPLLKLNTLLAKLTSLSRLEISVSADEDHAHAHGPTTPPRLELDSTSLSAQARRLQWLNLASNSNLSLLATPLARLTALEYLNLESSHLDAFHLYGHFVTSTTTGGRAHSNLSSLNLARNGLSSLERDLFCCSSRQVEAAHLFRLPSLSQLDLSHNRLTSINTQEAHLILSSFPQLANLYLQHNQIKHLNLSPLLGTDWRYLARDRENATTLHQTFSSSSSPSKLEFIDLSHNELVALIAFSQVASAAHDRTPNGPRLRSINLAHNRLRRPINLIDPRLVDLLVFPNSLVETQQPEVINLDSFTGSTIFNLTGGGGGEKEIKSSLCDYLSTSRLVPGPTESITDDTFLTELLLDHNRLVQLEAGDLTGAPCQGIETLALNDNSLTHIAPGAFDSLAHLHRLDLSANQLAELPANLFDHLPELRVLNLAANRLTKSFSMPLVHLANLRELYLQDNALESTWQVLSGSNSSSLTILDLSRNKFSHLPPNAFTHLNQLTHLNLEGNKQLMEFNWLVLFGQSARVSSSVSQIELRTTADSADQKSDKRTSRRKKVQRVKTSDRKAQRRRSARSSAASMRDEGTEYAQSAEMTSHLNLRDNRLVSFGPPAAAGATIRCDLVSSSLQAFQALDLSHNSIRELANNSLACFYHLELLDLSFNHLRTLNEFAMAHLTHLTHLNVANNYLVHANGNLWPGLRHLDLSQNQLGSFGLLVAGDDRPTSSELEHLNLSDNYNLKLDTSELLALLAASSNTLRQLKLARIGSIWTNDLGNDSARPQFDLELESLDLGQVNRIDSHFWPYVTNLRVERLALCPPTQRENFTLARWLSGNTEKLHRELDLSRCQLTSSTLRQLLTVKTNSVVRLNLSHNKLNEWPPLVNSPHLVDLDLSHNKLTGRLFRVQEPHANQMDQLEYLNLSSNALTSFCRDETESGDRQCKQVVVRLMPRLRHLDLSHNKFITIPSDLLDQWQYLETVWLRHNQLTLVAPPAGQHVPLASRLRLLDLSCNGQLQPASQNLSRPNWQVQHGELEDNLLPIAPPAPPRDLIIYKDEERAVIECSHLSDFTRRAQSRSSVMRPITRWRSGWYATGENDQRDYFDDDRQSPSESVAVTSNCPMPRELRLDNSSWSDLEFAGSHPNLVALSSTGNQIRTIGEISSRLAPRSRARVIYLDLSRNDIGPASFSLGEICARFPNLQTLELVQQTNLQEVSLQEHDDSASSSFARNCTRLAHVNLSNNKLRSIKPSDTGEPLDSVLVLRLDHNHLQDLDEDLLRSLPNLRYLDLRYNQIVELTDIVSLAHLSNVLLDIMLDQQPPVNRFVLQLTRDMNALAVSRETKMSNQTFSLEVSSSGHSGHRQVVVSKQMNSQHFIVRFCTLNRTELHKVCLRSEPGVIGRQQQRRSVCFALRPPPHGPSCTTNIADKNQEENNNLTSVQTRTESLMSSGDLSTTTTNKTIAVTSEGKTSEYDDPVLSFIDQLKWAWLRVKQFDLAAYLAQVSQVKQDSVLVTLNGRHPIYTLTVIKLGLVLAALCVILLSIAMFALLTATVIGGGESGASSKRQKLRRQNKVASDQESVESSYEHAASRAGKGDDETTTTTSGGGATKSQDTSEGSRYSRHTSATTASSGSGSVSNLNTVREAEHRLQVAATSGAQQQHQHHLMLQLNCSTPSSSLAPSSVETGETMQAVDSLQSCSFTRAQRQEIYDSQRTLTAPGGQAHFNSVDQYQQPVASEGPHAVVSPALAPLPPPPVATVMRMVKSSTFDGVGASMAPTGGTDPASYSFAAAEAAQRQHQRVYGTLRNSRQHYTAGGGASYNYTLSARQQPPPVPPSRATLRSGGAGEFDPATLSLLSLNSQLSGGGGGGGMQLSGGEQVNGQAATEASLCQYHTRQQAMQRARDQRQQPQQDQHRELLLLAGELQHSCQHHSSTAMSAANGTLFELEEDQLQLATDWRGGCEQQEADYQLAPPPPPPSL